MPKKTKIDELHFQVLERAPRATDIRRAKILEGVIDILSREGVDELTFEKIGKQVGMARSHVVYYFKDRNDLVRSAMLFAALSAQRVIVSHLGDAKDWKKRLTLYVEGNFLWIKRYPAHATCYALLFYQAALKPEYRALHSQIREAGAQRIEDILSPVFKGKKLRRYAKAVQGLITGNLIDVLTTDQGHLFEQRLEETIALVQEWTKSA